MNCSFDHIVQSKEWAEFKKLTDVKSINAGGVFYTIHKTPYLPLNLAYCPKVNPQKIDFDEVKKSLVKNNCLAIRFDVPNVLAEDISSKNIFEKASCAPSPKSTFAQSSIFLDLTKSEEGLFKNLHPKARYNVRLAQKKGVTVRGREDEKSFEEFLRLQRDTATRQGFFVHPDSYYQKFWKVLREKGVAYLMTAEYEGEILSAWVLFVYKGVLYYPYGGSSQNHKELMASDLLAWEAILFGKNKGCKLFDMWGASDPSNVHDPWAGFTRFKLKFGGEMVHFLPSYDLVVHKPKYLLFNALYKLFWVFLRHSGKRM